MPDASSRKLRRRSAWNSQQHACLSCIERVFVMHRIHLRRRFLHTPCRQECHRSVDLFVRLEGRCKLSRVSVCRLHVHPCIPIRTRTMRTDVSGMFIRTIACTSSPRRYLARASVNTAATWPFFAMSYDTLPARCVRSWTASMQLGTVGASVRSFTGCAPCHRRAIHCAVSARSSSYACADLPAAALAPPAADVSCTAATDASSCGVTIGFKRSKHV